MIKSFVFHSIDYDRIAAAERWYREKHGPQIAGRYGAWLQDFVSFRPIPAPEAAADYGLTNWLCTVGLWRELPGSDTGNLAMSPPREHARAYSSFTQPMPEDDWKGNQLTEEELAPLRWVQLFRWPQGVDAQAGERWLQDSFAPAACENENLRRFFSYRCLPPGAVKLPGYWNAEALRTLKGSPEDHRWDRVVEMWFDSFHAWSDFVHSALPAPPWAAREGYPFVEPGQDFVSAFLLEAPAFVWKKG